MEEGDRRGMRARERVVKDEEIKPRQKHFQKTWVTWKQKQSAEECRAVPTLKEGKQSAISNNTKMYQLGVVQYKWWWGFNSSWCASLPTELPSHGLLRLVHIATEPVTQPGCGEKRCRNSSHQSVSNGVHKDQMALSCPWCCYLHRALQRGSARAGRPHLIDYQEAGTGIWGSSVHYSYRTHLPEAKDGELSCYWNHTPHKGRQL